jgi:ATP-dependent RNA helicase DeaD
LPKSFGCDIKHPFYTFRYFFMSTTEKILSFSELGLSQQILNSLSQKGFEIPTPIQEQVIPLLLAGEQNIIGQAATGTGKTAAF